jgi:hypothetical protein
MFKAVSTTFNENPFEGWSRLVFEMRSVRVSAGTWAVVGIYMAFIVLPGECRDSSLN